MIYNFDFILPHIVEKLKSVKKEKGIPIYQSRLTALEEMSKSNRFSVSYIGQKPNAKLFNTPLMSDGSLRLFLS